jgi:hypothetical protein
MTGTATAPIRSPAHHGTTRGHIVTVVSGTTGSTHIGVALPT